MPPDNKLLGSIATEIVRYVTNLKLALKEFNQISIEKRCTRIGQLLKMYAHAFRLKTSLLNFNKNVTRILP